MLRISVVRGYWITGLATALIFGCATPSPGAAPPAGAGPASTMAPAVSSTAPAASTAERQPLRSPPNGASSEAAAASAQATPCGSLECLAFASPAQAFAYVLAQNPSILALGETHALKTATGPKSATLRFQEELLPALQGRASSLVVELLAPDAACRPKTEAVRQKQTAVTEQQRDTDQGEFVALGQRAKDLSITPFILRPDCAQYQSILDAGDDAISRMLTLIAELTEKRVRELYAETQRRFPNKLVVTYGGALHNDVVARPNAAAWTFGPALSALAPGKYIELDLIVPEFIKDSEVWRALPWYSFYRSEIHGAEPPTTEPQRTETRSPERYPTQTLLYHPSAQAYALIFPRSGSSPAGASATPPHDEASK